jgi:hypothetical protein
MSVRLGAELASLRREAGAARSEIGRLAAGTPDLRPLIAAATAVTPLVQAGLDDLVAGLAPADPVARALARLSASPPVSEAESASEPPPTAATARPAAVSRPTRDQPAAFAPRRPPPARDLARPARARLGLLLGEGHQLSATPKMTRAVSTAASPVALLALQPPVQAGSPMARAGGERRVLSHPAGSPTIARILAGEHPESGLVAADALRGHGAEPASALPQAAIMTDVLARSLGRLQRHAGAAASARGASSLPTQVVSRRPRREPVGTEPAPGQPHRSALARLAVAGQSFGPRTEQPTRAGPLAKDLEEAPAATVEQSLSGAPELPPLGDEDDLGARLATILRREARRAGIDLTGWP